MALKKYLSLDRLTEYDALIKEEIASGDESVKSYVDTEVAKKANSSHEHDDRYYTESEIDSKISAINTSINNIAGGTTVVKEAEHAESADEATHAASSDSATKATQDGNGKVIADTYETKTDATAKLTEAKTYTDTVAAGKADSTHNHDEDYDEKGAAADALTEAKGYTDSKTSSLASTTVVDNKISAHNTSTTAHSDIRDLISALTTKVNNFLDVDDTTTDQLSEVLTLIENNKGTLESLTSNKVNVSDIVDNLTTASSSKVLSANQGVVLKGLIDALQEAVDGKAAASHDHAIADVTGLQNALDGKAAASHGVHVTYSTAAPVMDGTASAGTADTVARSDHKHPTDTSRAAQTDLDAHTSNTTVHITTAERTNWNAAKTHADSAHAPSDAEKNQNAFSNVKVGSTTIAADIVTDTLTLVAGTNVTITPDANADSITISATDTVYTHPNSGVTAGTYKSVTVNAQGHVTAGSNPTTLAGYGITDAASKTHTHAISDITNLQTTLNNASSAISANTGSITALTERTSALETKVGDGFEEITSAEIQALFA